MRRRFLIALALVILPFALLASGQAVWRLYRAYDNAQFELLEAAKATRVAEANVVVRAESVLRALSAQPAIRGGGPSCDAALAEALEAFGPQYGNIAVLDANGVVTCSAIAVEADSRDRSAEAWWLRLRERNRFMLGDLHQSVLADEPTIVAALPVANAAGQASGALALSINRSGLADIMRGRQIPKGALVALVDGAGAVVASTDESIAGALVQGPLLGTADKISGAKDASGGQWQFAVSPVYEDELYIVYAARESALFRWSYIDVGLNVALPLLMAAFAFWAIRLSADRFVLRWVSYLQRVAKAYGRGHYALRSAATAEADNAPGEIQDLARSMDSMADNIRERDLKLRNAIEQRELMLREIHHRVKNNLQIIASLLQIEARKVVSPDGGQALSLTLARVNAVSLVHRLMEEAGPETVVNLKTLLVELTALLTDAFGADPNDSVRVDATDRWIKTDAAVVVALYVVDTVSQLYLKKGEKSPGLIGLVVGMEQSEESVRITLASAVADKLEDSSFLTAYLRQLKGAITRSRDTSRAVATLEFAAPPITPQK